MNFITKLLLRLDYIFSSKKYSFKLKKLKDISKIQGYFYEYTCSSSEPESNAYPFLKYSIKIYCKSGKKYKEAYEYSIGYKSNHGLPKALVGLNSFMVFDIEKSIIKINKLDPKYTPEEYLKAFEYILRILDEDDKEANSDEKNKDGPINLNKKAIKSLEI
tara:strand:- start:3304 stop:3786 length:483 start_codon:yes stop_codon:yes gene_type:complete